MNTLVYADIPPDKASNASSIASTLQQLSISFGVAAAGLTTAFFIPSSVRSNPVAFLRGVHKALLDARGMDGALDRGLLAAAGERRPRDRQQREVAVAD